MAMTCRYCGRQRAGDPCQSCIDAGIPDSEAGVRGSYNPDASAPSALMTSIETRKSQLMKELETLTRQASALGISAPAPANAGSSRKRGGKKKGGNS